MNDNKHATSPSAQISTWASPYLHAFNQLPGRVRTAISAALVLICAICCFFVGNGKPGYLFWDENYHITSAQRYLDGLAHFEPHPPLGLLLIAAGEKLSNSNPNIDKRVLVADKYLNGDQLPKDFKMSGLRSMPALFGAAAALLFFGLLYTLLGSRLLALLFSTLYVFENAYIVHFRAVHLDSFQLFFCIAVLWQFVYLWQKERALKRRHYAALALLCGCAIMVKINAVVMLSLFPVLYFRDAHFQTARRLKQRMPDFIAKTGISIAGVCAVVFCVFSLHTLIGQQMPNASTSAGTQDIENMSPTYRDYLLNQQTPNPMTVIAVTRDYFKFMDKDHLGVPKLDVCKPGENGSHPLNWPVLNKTINYRWDSNEGLTRYVQLTGNQISWLLGLLAILYSIFLIAGHRLNRQSIVAPKTYHLIEVFTGLYMVFMLLHLYLGTQRVMYLYHYFIGLLISYILVVLNWSYICTVHEASRKQRTISALCIAACIIASSLFFMPLSNHWPLSHQACEARNIFIRILSCQ